MIRSFAFTTQGKLHSKDIETFLMPTLLADTNLFLWVDLEKPTPEESRLILEEIFHFHQLSVEDCVSKINPRCASAWTCCGRAISVTAWPACASLAP